MKKNFSDFFRAALSYMDSILSKMLLYLLLAFTLILLWQVFQF